MEKTLNCSVERALNAAHSLYAEVFEPGMAVDAIEALATEVAHCVNISREGDKNHPLTWSWTPWMEMHFHEVGKGI